MVLGHLGFRTTVPNLFLSRNFFYFNKKCWNPDNF